MQPNVVERGFIATLLHRADKGEMHLPEGVTAVDPDEYDDFDEWEEDEGIGKEPVYFSSNGQSHKI